MGDCAWNNLRLQTPQPLNPALPLPSSSRLPPFSQQKLSRGQIRDDKASRDTLDAMRAEAIQTRKVCDSHLHAIAQAILNSAQVVCATCTGAGDHSLKDR